MLWQRGGGWGGVGRIPRGLDEGRENGGRGGLRAAGRKAVGGVQRGNRAAACLVAMIINRQENNVIRSP